jgi:hypothetical protein
LAYLATGDRDFVNQIDGWKKRWEADEDNNDDGLPSRKRTRTEYILIFNESLVVFVSGKPREASIALLKVLRPLVSNNEVLHEELLNISTQIAFLLLDCMLTISEGYHGD